MKPAVPKKQSFHFFLFRECSLSFEKQRLMIYITVINIREKKEIGAENMAHLQKYYLGIDIGSTTFKAVIMTDDGKGRIVHAGDVSVRGVMDYV